MKFKDEIHHKNLCGIYQIVNLANDKRYIGQTKENFMRRFWHHRWNLNSGKYHNAFLQNAWNKYGGDMFEFSVLHILQTEDDIDVLEIEYILQYHTTNVLHGYNMQVGGQCENLHHFISAESRKVTGEKNRQHMLGRRFSEETKAKMRASSKHLRPNEDTLRKLSEYMSNRAVSDETKDKIRVANMGSKSKFAKLNEADVAKIKQLLINGIAQNEIAKQYGVHYSTISAISNNRTWKHVVTFGWDRYQQNKKIL